MIEKELFLDLVDNYFNLNTYIDKLNDLNVNIWENENYGEFVCGYVNLLSLAMGLEINGIYDNVLEEYLYSYDENVNYGKLYDYIKWLNNTKIELDVYPSFEEYDEHKEEFND